MLSENLARIRMRIQQACRRSGRDPASVTLVCVTKGIPAETIRRVVTLGVADLGENRVQEARAKQLATGYKLQASGLDVQPAACSLPHVRWHLIGHLQRNKAKDAVELFQAIHSVDSRALAEELNRQAAKHAPSSKLQAPSGNLQPAACSLEPLEVFVQVNVSGETTKFGCRPDEAVALAQTVAQLSHLRLKGLMTLAPFSEDPERARPHFGRLRELRDGLATSLSLEPSTLSLSMGMSQDFEVAIEEGADVVRIGTAIFGDQRQETRDKRLEQ